jgi:hypothetical protein
LRYAGDLPAPASLPIPRSPRLWPFGSDDMRITGICIHAGHNAALHHLMIAETLVLTQIIRSIQPKAFTIMGCEGQMARPMASRAIPW